MRLISYKSLIVEGLEYQNKIKRQNEIKEQTATLVNLMWQDNKEAKTVRKNWNDAKDYCKKLNLLGFNDWRLPTKKELETIVNRYRTPAIKKEFNNISSSSYWSSTSSSTIRTQYAWFVNFYYGNVHYNDKSNSHYIRCVRDR